MTVFSPNNAQAYLPPENPRWPRPSPEKGEKGFPHPLGHNGCPDGPMPLDPRLVLPDADELRGDYPMATGLLDYFPGALAEVAKVAKIGNDQHNPGQPLHWARDKSQDHADKIVRHLLDRGRRDGRGVRHTARMAWRALALLQTELEADGEVPLARASRGLPDHAVKCEATPTW